MKLNPQLSGSFLALKVRQKAAMGKARKAGLGVRRVPRFWRPKGKDGDHE